MGEADSTHFRFEFNGSVRVETRGSALSANAGGLVLREIDERLGLIADLSKSIKDPRDQDKITHPLSELLRSRIFALALGHTDQDDLDALRDDPVLRVGVSERRGTSSLDSPGEDEAVPDGLASQPTQSRLVKALSVPENLDRLNDALAEWAVREFAELGCQGPVVLDIDSFPIEVHGQQPGSSYNGHYRMRCFHPLITMVAGTASVLRADLRPGNVWTAEGALEHIERVISLAGSGLGGVGAVRGDAGFVSEEILSFLESCGLKFALRLPANKAVERIAAPFLRHSTERGGEPRVEFHELPYRAGTWTRDRRVLLVVTDKPGELFPSHFFLVTDFTPEEFSGEMVLEFYRQRATMERHIGEIKSVLSPALSSAPRPKSHHGGKEPERRTTPRDGEKANAATFLLYMLAYDLINLVRNLTASTQPMEEPVPSIGRIRESVLKVAARLTRSARYARFVINEAMRPLWHALLRRIHCIGRPIDSV